MRRKLGVLGEDGLQAEEDSASAFWADFVGGKSRYDDADGAENGGPVPGDEELLELCGSEAFECVGALVATPGVGGPGGDAGLVVKASGLAPERRRAADDSVGLDVTA